MLNVRQWFYAMRDFLPLPEPLVSSFVVFKQDGNGAYSLLSHCRIMEFCGSLAGNGWSVGISGCCTESGVPFGAT